MHTMGGTLGEQAGAGVEQSLGVGAGQRAGRVGSGPLSACWRFVADLDLATCGA